MFGLLLKSLFVGLFFAVLAACGNTSLPGISLPTDQSATPEPTYFGKPTSYDQNSSVHVRMKSKFRFRPLSFVPGNYLNGLTGIASAGAPIAFAEFHVYNAAGSRIQQGETDTDGVIDFWIPASAGTYAVKVFSRADNDYIKVSVLQDIYSNTPYSISKYIAIDTSDIASGLKDLTLNSADYIFAEANENVSANVEGGAFNIMFDVLIANEYVRRNIGQNGDSGDGTPSTTPKKWWVADKVVVYWKAGFNPNTYFDGFTPLSFYVGGTGKLYILGGESGDVKASDTDHFDDSVILHEYAHFLEDKYGHSESPGGAHTGNFIIDPRLAWSEGWANYFQAAVLTGADAFDNSQPENRIPTNKRFHYYVDTRGYDPGTNAAGVTISFSLAADGRSSYEPDNVNSDPSGAGIFREVSVSRTLYKSSRGKTDYYQTNRPGGGINFSDIWRAFSGADNSGDESINSRTHPASFSLKNITKYPLPNAGLFNWLITKQNISTSSEWDAILTEEKQNKTTQDYGYFLTKNTNPGFCTYSFSNGVAEQNMYSGDPLRHSHQLTNNDFFLYYHDGSSNYISLSYSTSGSNQLDLDLLLYKSSYTYTEDDSWYPSKSSSEIIRSSRNPASTLAENISLTGLPSGFYVLNVKINAYNKMSSALNGSATYMLQDGSGQNLCGTERP